MFYVRTLSGIPNAIGARVSATNCVAIKNNYAYTDQSNTKWYVLLNLYYNTTLNVFRAV
jgi:hypothetical protein